MNVYKKDILKATAAVLLVIVLSVATYLLFPGVPQQVTYGPDVTIQNDRLATEDLIGRTIAGGGGYVSIEYRPVVHLTFENGTECFYSTSKGQMNESWTVGATINASGLKVFRVDWRQGWGGRGSLSKEFQTVVAGGNFSWHGIYGRGYQINTTLLVDNDRIDFGTRSENDVLLVFNLDSSTAYSAHAQTVGMIYVEPAAANLKYVVRQTEPYWGFGGWEIETSRLLKMVGQSRSASISFDGSAWLGGNYTLKENGTARNGTMDLAKNVSFGTADMTFEDGAISTLSFKFNSINIILFARPEE